MLKLMAMLGLWVLLLGYNWALAASFILDPGHSPKRPGTASCSGGLEYRYNEILTETIVNYLRKQRIPVEVTKAKGGEISLQDRAKKAQGKRLFLSIHHDSAQEQFIQKINGHPCSNKARGYSLFVSGKNPYFERSLMYAKVLGQMLVERGLTPSTHHGEPIKGENRLCLDPKLGIYQFDDLIVLKQSKAPALLLEAAVIINPEDDELARSFNYQLIIAEAIGQTFRFIESMP
ncbi:MAG: N-acetylmuramoyl-L-alanine amidase [Desulfovibrionaceae bacterium]|nr:N-acetylmuramoyl-L-alanine amidase [Desulfovibrionaceae bacterium]